MNKIKQLTETCWLITGQDDYMLFDAGEEFLLVSKTSTTSYNSFESCTSQFKKLVEQTPIVTQQTFIKSMPVKHEGIQNINESDYSYTRGVSKVRFVAGYWCILRNQTWSYVYCPKQETLDSNSIGPLSLKLEAINKVSSLNNFENKPL